MKNKLFIFILLLGSFSLTGCGERVEIVDGTIRIIPATNSRLYLGLNTDNEFYWGLKPETLEDLQEHRDKFAEEHKDNAISLNVGLAIIDSTIDIVEKNGWYVTE